MSKTIFDLRAELVRLRAENAAMKSALDKLRGICDCIGPHDPKRAECPGSIVIGALTTPNDLLY